ncbi:hypothetical protein A2997_02295 [Candidatus Nomurabacteria bacterium RIFCSPLOWO2_01_FULL_36_10b]|uniref:ParB-like N-terminal domain-containing protein n=1 Tax=Candidatus Nomurabacteria bacterium RIFCSPLOWO2_01_FULL_36_10b TaxID=1801766 RepID=A0A1F6WN16_9BACT|nr:MAG: hypothetical protein A2997_02295 [Candidatus Nomurabacteria bacterium RIFCSPLOWO2_01_FULL_36_10b]
MTRRGRKKCSMESNIKNNKIFWVDIDSIFPNPYQPRRDFDEASLRDLADSIRQYGILQPPTVSESGKLPDGRNKYELIAGERRLRASKLAGLIRVPVVIRTGDDEKARFELAIIENLQREDLNPVERARAFQRLVDEFKMTHSQIGKQMGKSREYVSNSLRLLSLPQEIIDGITSHKILEGHTRPLMMLADKPEEQITLFKEIVYKKMSVRESEKVARKISQDKVRKAKHRQDPKIASFEQVFSETLGTRVSIEEGEKGAGGKIVIDYFSPEDLDEILELIQSKNSTGNPRALLEKFENMHSAIKIFSPSLPKKEIITPSSPKEKDDFAPTSNVAPSPKEKDIISISNNYSKIFKKPSQDKKQVFAFDANTTPKSNSDQYLVNTSNRN